MMSSAKAKHSFKKEGQLSTRINFITSMIFSFLPRHEALTSIVMKLRACAVTIFDTLEGKVEYNFSS